MKREYRKYIAWAAIIAVLYGLMKTMSDFFATLAGIIFLYMLYLAGSLVWSLIKQKHTWRSILKREGIAAILVVAAISVGYATESPEAKQAAQERRVQEKYDKQAKYEAWMAQKQDQAAADKTAADQGLQAEPIDNEPADPSPTQEDYDKQAQYEEWQNYMAQQAYDKQAQYEEWQNYMAQQAYDKQAQYEEWIQYSLNKIKAKLAKAEPGATLNIYSDANGGKILDVTYDIQSGSSTSVKEQFYQILKAVHPSPSNPVSKVNIHGKALLIDGNDVYHEGDGLTCIFTAANAKKINFDSDGNAYSCIKNAQFYREVPFKE